MASSDSDSGFGEGLESSDRDCSVNGSEALSEFKSDFQKCLDVGDQLCSFLESVDICPGVEDPFAHLKLRVTCRVDAKNVQGKDFCLFESFDTVIATVTFPCLGHRKCSAFEMLRMVEDMKDCVQESGKPKMAVLLNDTSDRVFGRNHLQGLTDIAQFLEDHKALVSHQPVVFWGCVVCSEPLLLRPQLVVEGTETKEQVVLFHCNKEVDSRCCETCDCT